MCQLAKTPTVLPQQMGDPPRPTVLIVNPIKVGLAHYTASVEHILSGCGCRTHRFEAAEPSAAGYGRLGWLTRYWSGVRREVAKIRPTAVFASWAALGYWDVRMLAAMAPGVPTYLVMHDPEPLAYAKGFGRAATRAARGVAGSTIVVHSSLAAQLVEGDRQMPRVVLVPHPMFEPNRPPVMIPVGEPVARVMGQYKVDRDLESLRQIAQRAPEGWRLEIIGRGWPEIDGWAVRDEFVSERSFDDLIRTSSAIVIPYRRFFQSGVAIRALEHAVPVVGPASSSLSDMLGSDCPWLVTGDDWTRSVSAAIHDGPGAAYATACALYSRVFEQWRVALDEIAGSGNSS